MRIASFNIRATPPLRPAQVRADLWVAHGTRARIINWQELAKIGWYRRALRALFPARAGWVHLHLRARCATSVDTQHYQVLGTTAHRLTRGNALLPQPSRWTNETIVQPRVLEQHPVAVLNSHFDNGAYNGRRRGERNRRARQRRWDLQFARTQQLVHDLHERGFDVVGSGDYNRVDLPKFHPQQQWVLEAGIVKMWVLLAEGHQHRVSDAVTITDGALFTDHPGLVATVGRRL